MLSWQQRNPGHTHVLWGPRDVEALVEGMFPAFAPAYRWVLDAYTGSKGRSIFGVNLFSLLVAACRQRVRGCQEGELRFALRRLFCVVSPHRGGGGTWRHWWRACFPPSRQRTGGFLMLTLRILEHK